MTMAMMLGLVFVETLTLFTFCAGIPFVGFSERKF